MVHSREGEKGDLGDTPQKIFSHAISLKKHLSEHRDQPRVHEKGFVNERAKMKESRQNYREIRAGAQIQFFFGGVYVRGTEFS